MRSIIESTAQETLRKTAKKISTKETSFFLQNLVKRTGQIEAQLGAPMTQREGNFLITSIYDYLRKHKTLFSCDTIAPSGFKKTGITTLHIYNKSFNVYICYFHLSQKFMAEFL